MEEQLINFETAKLAKDKGFIQSFSYSQYINIKNDKWILYTKEEADSIDNSIGIGENIRYSVPTQSLLQEWLRKKHNIHIWVEPSHEKEPRYSLNIFNANEWHENKFMADYGYLEGYLEYEDPGDYMWYNTYEEALEAGLQEALKFI